MEKGSRLTCRRVRFFHAEQVVGHEASLQVLVEEELLMAQARHGLGPAGDLSGGWTVAAGGMMRYEASGHFVFWGRMVARKFIGMPSGRWDVVHEAIRGVADRCGWQLMRVRSCLWTRWV
jgi:hypothetical protein